MLKAIFVEIWLISAANTVPSATFVLMCEKAESAAPAPTFTNMTTLDSYANKKNVFYTTQGLVAIANSNPSPLIRTWIKVPKSKGRFGLDDRFRVNIAAIGGQNLVGCGLTIYKSYS